MSNIYQPTNITPSTFASLGDNIIAQTDNVSISWQINGNTNLAGFYVELFDINNQPLNGYTPSIINNGYNLPMPAKTPNGEANFITYSPTSTTWSSFGISDGNEYRSKISCFWEDMVYARNLTTTLVANSYYYFFNSATNQYVKFRATSNMSSQGVFCYDAENETLAFYKSATITNNVFSIPNNTEFEPLIISISNTKFNDGSHELSQWSMLHINAYKYVQQLPLNVFFAKTAPILTINAVQNAMLLSVNANFSQSQGDAVSSVRWILTESESDSVVKDTGFIITNNLQFSFNGLFDSEIVSYNLLCEVITSSGVSITANETISVSVFSDVPLAQITATPTNDSGLKISWEAFPGEGNYYIYRIAQYNFDLIATIPETSPREIIDYSMPSGAYFDYAVFRKKSNSSMWWEKDTENTACQRQTYYALIETTQDTENENVYNVLNVWKFGTNIEIGAISNNNTPNWLTNFTPYRFRQPSLQQGKSGTLTSLLSNPTVIEDKGIYSADKTYYPLNKVTSGNVAYYALKKSQGKPLYMLEYWTTSVPKYWGYNDSAEEMEALFNISTSTNSFFIKDTKGNIYMVSPSDAITQTIAENTANKQVTVSIPWEEIGSFEGITLLKM